MNLFPIAATDMDMIIGLIAVVTWILAQIFGRKKTDSTPRGPAPDSTSPVDPRDELRKFFEEMEKTMKPAAEPKPSAPPPPLPPPRSHSHPRREAGRSRAFAPPAVAPQEQSLPVPSAQEAAQAFMEPPTGKGPASLVASVPLPHRPPVIEGIQDPASLRKMIVTMEVLGKPVALRQ